MYQEKYFVHVIATVYDDSQLTILIDCCHSVPVSSDQQQQFELPAALVKHLY